MRGACTAFLTLALTQSTTPLAITTSMVEPTEPASRLPDDEVGHEVTCLDGGTRANPRRLRR